MAPCSSDISALSTGGAPSFSLESLAWLVRSDLWWINAKLYSPRYVIPYTQTSEMKPFRPGGQPKIPWLGSIYEGKNNSSFQTGGRHLLAVSRQFSIESVTPAVPHFATGTGDNPRLFSLISKSLCVCADSDRKSLTSLQQQCSFHEVQNDPFPSLHSTNSPADSSRRPHAPALHVRSASNNDGSNLRGERQGPTQECASHLQHTYDTCPEYLPIQNTPAPYELFRHSRRMRHALALP